MLFFVVFAVMPPRSLMASDNTGAGLGFEQAWQQLQERSDLFAARRSAIEQQKELQQAAAALDLPGITLGGSYTRLSDPVEMDAAEMEPMASLSPAGVQHSLAGLVRAGSISPQFAAEMGALLQGVADGGLDTTTEILDENVFTSSINAFWPVFTGWRIQAVQDIAEQQTETAKARLSLLRRVQYEVLARVYFGLVLRKQVLATHKEVEKGLQLHFEHARALEKQGQIAKVERLKAEAAFDRAKVKSEKSRRALEIAELALDRMLRQEGVIPQTPLFISGNLPEMAHFVDQTLNNHPGLTLLKVKKKQAESLIEMEKGHYYPDIFLFGHYKLYKDDSIVGESAPDWVAGVGIGMKLLDPGGRGSKLRAARSALDSLGYLYSQAERDLSVLVEKNWQEAIQSASEFRGLKSSITLAEETVRLREKGFSQGVSTSLDVVDAHLFLEEVKTKQLVASYDYVIRLTRLLAMSGEMGSFDSYARKRYQEVTPRGNEQ